MYGFCYAVSSALGRLNRIFFESNLFQSEKIKVIHVIDISEYLQQQQVVPKEDVLEVAKSPHACK